MKVVLNQFNPIVGDIEGNLAAMARAAKKALDLKPDLIVFSELSLVGYPPRDLLCSRAFLAKVRVARTSLLALSQELGDCGLLLGMPTPHESPSGLGLYNSAVLFCEGQEIFAQHKTLLPTYDVFDEKRYFDPSPETRVFAFKGEKLGISICEDIWSPQPRSERLLYADDPIAALVNKGASLLINISASPFEMRKPQLRLNLLQKHVKAHGLPLLFVNQVGGNDELIFDGGSLALDAQGAVMAQGKMFEEDSFCVDTAASGALHYDAMDDVESVYRALVLGVRDYFHKCGAHKAIVGLSGGIDSALVAVIAAEALGSEHVLGITMPSRFSSEGSQSDSQKLAHNLGLDFRSIPIESLHQSYLDVFAKEFAGRDADITEENIQARIRGNLLMAFSNKCGGMVLTTGNKSELAMGYCTLYGDMAGALAVISDVPKTLVYALSRWINREKIIIPEAILSKAPSAELRPNQKDQDSLPDYELLDDILHRYVEENQSAADMCAAGLAEDVVEWVIRRVDQNEYKRWQSSPGLKVTSTAFGWGRRMPIAARYHH